MYIEKNIVDQLDIRYFLKNNEFKIGSNDIDILYNASDDEFGDSFAMLYFYFLGYSVVITVNEDKSQIINQKIENIKVKKVKNVVLKNIINFSDLEQAFPKKTIEAIYQDENEKVVFLKTGPMLYYNNINNKYLLSQIIQEHKPSKILAKNILEKVYPI